MEKKISLFSQKIFFSKFQHQTRYAVLSSRAKKKKYTFTPLDIYNIQTKKWVDKRVHVYGMRDTETHLYSLCVCVC